MMIEDKQGKINTIEQEKELIPTKKNQQIIISSEESLEKEE